MSLNSLFQLALYLPSYGGGLLLQGKHLCKEDERAAGAGSPALSGPLSEEKISYGGGGCVGIASIARASDDRAEQGRTENTKEHDNGMVA